MSLWNDGNTVQEMLRGWCRTLLQYLIQCTLMKHSTHRQVRQTRYHLRASVLAQEAPVSR
jgi:hypothetical protein